MNRELIMADSYELINGRKVIKKHVATIHCSNKLSLLERKISNALLFHAYPDLKETLIHEISLDKLKRLLNSVTRNHKVLKEALKTLISTVIEWNILDEKIPEFEIEGWNASTILSSVSITNGIVKYQYSELIKSLIIDPAIYGKINLLIQSRFKSSYALALYENCARYRGLKYTKEFPYSLFRKLMGVEDGKYEIFRDFNRRVLSAAITEINTCSDIFIIPDIKRKGRKIHSIKFKLEERAIKKRLGKQPKEHIGPKDDVFVLEKFGMDPTEIKNLITKFGEGRVSDAIEYVKSRPKYKTGEIKNIAGYLRSAIEKNYVDKNIVASHEEILSFEDRIEKKREKQFIDNLNDEYIKYRSRETKNIFDSLSAEKKKEIENTFIKGNHIYRSRSTMVYYESFGISNILVFESGLADYLISEHPELTENLFALDEFKEKSS